MLKSSIKWAAAAALAVVAANAQARGYVFTVFQFPGGSSYVASGINNHGHVAGTAWDSNGLEQAVVWDGGVSTALPGWGGDNRAVAVNRHGQVAGTAYVPQGGLRLVRWDGTTPTTLDVPPRAYPVDVVGINDHGWVAGNLELSEEPLRAVTWGSRGKLTYLDKLGSWRSVARGINRAGDVAGYMEFRDVDYMWRPVVWRAGVPTILPVLQEVQCCNQASSVNDLGQVAGWSSSPSAGPVRAVVWNGDTPTALQSLSSADNALAINNRQQVVGVLNAGGQTSAALWDLTTGQGVDLNIYLTKSQRRAGWELRAARAINDQGVIVGEAFNSKTWRYSAFQLTPKAAD